MLLQHDKMAKLIWALVLFAGLLQTFAEEVEQPSGVGWLAKIEDYPSLAQVEVRVGYLWVQQCAASILTSYHALSAASCFYGALYYPENRRLRAGASYRGTGGDIGQVRYAHVHEDYGLLGKDADIAVIELISPFTLDGIKIAQVSIMGEGIVLPFGLQVQVAGWGTTILQNEYEDTYRDLGGINLFVTDADSCLITYLGTEEPQYITENMICLGKGYYSGRDFDARDLGAPVKYSGTLAGILAFGERDANDEIPVVATSVSSYTSWIIEQAGSISK